MSPPASTFIVARVSRSLKAELEPLPLNELAHAVLSCIPDVASLQPLRCDRGELLVQFKWNGPGNFHVPAAILDRYGLSIELDSVSTQASRHAAGIGAGA